MSDWILGILQLLLAVVVVLAMLCGLYLLIFRKDDNQFVEGEGKYHDFSFGKYKVPIGFALVVLAVAAAAYSVTEIEKIRQTQRIENLEGTITTRNSTIDSQNKSIEKLDGEIESLETKQNELADANKDLERDLEAEQRLVEAKNNEIASLQNKIREAASTIDGLDENIRQLERSSELQQRRFDAQTEALEAARTAMRDAEQIARDIASADSERGLSPRQREHLDRVRSGIHAINDDLQYLQLRETALLRVGGKVPGTTYEIYAPHLQGEEPEIRGIGLFRFYSESFEIEGMRSRDELELIFQDLGEALCDAISEYVVSGVGLDDALARIDSLEKYEGFSDQLTVLAEYEYFRQQLQALAVDPRVYVRGYADGERAGWQNELHHEVPPTISVHPMSRETASPLRDWRFEEMTEPRQLADTSGQYNNTQLPNLRGMATREVLETLGTTCGLPGRNPDVIEAEVGILDGRLDPEFGGEDRKSRVFVSIGLR